MVKDFPEKRFIGGGEESFGYMVGDFVRDKDAVTSTLLACEIAATAKASNKKLFDMLIEAYTKYGFYKEHLVSLTKKGMQGAQEIAQMMVDFRDNPLKTLDGSEVVRIDDYQSGLSTNLQTGEKTPITLPRSNVLVYTTADGTRMAARPSGTEPKIKFYFSINQPLENSGEYDRVSRELDEKIARMLKELKLD